MGPGCKRFSLCRGAAAVRIAPEGGISGQVSDKSGHFRPVDGQPWRGFGVTRRIRPSWATEATSRPEAS